MYLCGPIFPITSKNEIRGDKTVTVADLENNLHSPRNHLPVHKQMRRDSPSPW